MPKFPGDASDSCAETQVLADGHEVDADALENLGLCNLQYLACLLAQFGDVSVGIHLVNVHLQN